MASDPKAAPSGPATSHREKGVRIFTYPKIIFIFPTLIMSLICWVGMSWVGEIRRHLSGARLKVKSGRWSSPSASPRSRPINATGEPVRGFADPEPSPTRSPVPKDGESPGDDLPRACFFFNLLILAIDFPRFTIFALILLSDDDPVLPALARGVRPNILEPLERLFQGVYVRANAQFYFMTSR